MEQDSTLLCPDLSWSVQPESIYIEILWPNFTIRNDQCCLRYQGILWYSIYIYPTGLPQVGVNLTNFSCSTYPSCHSGTCPLESISITISIKTDFYNRCSRGWYCLLFFGKHQLMLRISILPCWLQWDESDLSSEFKFHGFFGEFWNLSSYGANT